LIVFARADTARFFTRRRDFRLGERGSTSPPIGQAQAFDSLKGFIAAHFTFYATRDAVVAAKAILREVTVRALHTHGHAERHARSVSLSPEPQGNP